MKGKLIVLTGPSASGKTTLAGELLAVSPNITRLVTCTTRAPRPDEVQDVDYHFLSKEEFEAGIEKGDFFEWAKVYNDYYGSRKQDVDDTLATGKNALAILDAQGASTIRHSLPDAKIIFIKSPLEDMKRRMSLRQGLTKDQLEKRIAELERESQLSGAAEFTVENKDGHLAEAVLAIREYLRS